MRRTMVLIFLSAAAAIFAAFGTLPAAAQQAVFPQNLTVIGEEAFYGCETMTEALLPEHVTEIGPRAFAYSAVKLIYLPASLVSISPDILEGCQEVLALAPQGSFAQQWCADHGIPFLSSDSVREILPENPSCIVKNGGTVTVRVQPEVHPALLRWESSDERIFTVDTSGTVTGQYPGQAALTISSLDRTVQVSLPVTVQANYRALLFSESTFRDGSVQRNRGDVRLMRELLAHVQGPDGGRYSVSSYDDLTASQVYDRITRILETPSRDGDVSLFFFASHGDAVSRTFPYAGRLYCINRETWLELPTLAQALAKIKGKVIVLLESCGPGAALLDFGNTDTPPSWPFIPRTAQGTVQEKEGLSDDQALNEAILSAFAGADPGMTVYPAAHGITDKGSNSFRTAKFVVMTASAAYQTSYSVGSDTYNLFPTAIYQGVGLSGPMPADIKNGNGDGLLTVHELFRYVYDATIYRQTPQVYPTSSSYVLFTRAD